MNCRRVCSVDYAGNVDSRKSNFGYVFTMFENAVYWKVYS